MKLTKLLALKVISSHINYCVVLKGNCHHRYRISADHHKQMEILPQYFKHCEIKIHVYEIKFCKEK